MISILQDSHRHVTHIFVIKAIKHTNNAIHIVFVA